MNRLSVTRVAVFALLCVFVASAAFAGTTVPLIARGSFSGVDNDPTVNVPFPTAGDAYCSATNGCGTIPVGGQTGFQWTAGDFVQSSVFQLPTNSVTDLTANWTYQDDLSGFDETWNVYVNNVLVAAAVLPDCGDCGTDGTVMGTVTFAGIAPLNGGYQVRSSCKTRSRPAAVPWPGLMAELPAYRLAALRRRNPPA